MSVLVLDFGSQVTQLIARRVREAGVYCEIVPYNKAEEALAKKPRAIILSGGPASVTESDTPRAPQSVFEMGVPVLGICYGEMTLSAQLGGRVESGHEREFGRAEIVGGRVDEVARQRDGSDDAAKLGGVDARRDGEADVRRGGIATLVAGKAVRAEAEGECGHRGIGEAAVEAVVARRQ